MAFAGATVRKITEPVCGCAPTWRRHWHIQGATLRGAMQASSGKGRPSRTVAARVAAGRRGETECGCAQRRRAWFGFRLLPACRRNGSAEDPPRGAGSLINCPPAAHKKGGTEAPPDLLHPLPKMPGLFQGHSAPADTLLCGDYSGPPWPRDVELKASDWRISSACM